ncbi:MAG: AraC family transcriptional regulator [Ruminococcaceae bacterium]|nr:AraC family transcriptional regulator [Oscillospiraceae bacterium]
MRSICKFVPAKNYNGDIKTVNFVFETDFHKLKQPFYYPINHMFLVTSGTGTLKLNSKEFKLKKGCLFFSFPQYFHEIETSDDFMYIYISFMGESVQGIFSELNISAENPVFENFDHLIDFWMSSITKLTHSNSNLLTEGVLLYTLSFISEESNYVDFKKKNENKFELIVYYIDNHYTETDLSLKKISNIFGYTPKYLSSIFKKNMGIGFTEYVNNLRVQYACSLIENNVFSVAEIATCCGYCDPFYFSKVFKSKTGFSPQTYIKRRKSEIEAE